MQQTKRWWQGRCAWLTLASIALTQSGCLAVAAGCAAGGGAAGYAYYKGRLERDYAANRDDVWAALHASLGELQMPVVKEEREAEEDHLVSRTADGDRVKIDIEIHPSRIPAEGTISKVCVRVATFGDEAVSSRILDQVDRHLIPAPPGTVLGQPQATNGAPPPPQPIGAPPQSPPPPLAQGANGKP